jgi:N-acetylmuramoyl-L-alanine amidase
LIYGVRPSILPRAERPVERSADEESGDGLHNPGEPIEAGRTGRRADPVSLYGRSPAEPDPVPRRALHLRGLGPVERQWFKSPKNTDAASAHLVVDRDGTAIQCVRFDLVAHHAGKSRWKDIVGLNRSSIGLELANWGYLRSNGSGWESYTGVRIPNPVMANHRNGNPNGLPGPIGWEPYPGAQIAAAIDITRLLVATYGITEIVGHDDIAPLRKWDPGPAFDMARFRARVFGGRAEAGDIRRSVTAAEGLNLRAGPGISHPVLRLLPQGTQVEPMESQGHWLGVGVIGADGAPTATGWVHERYLD